MTIQFTYNKKENIYCFGFWKDGEFIVRAWSRDRQEVLEQFCKELEQLENS